MVTREDGWHGLCRYWASTKFNELSARKRSNRGYEASHTYGGDGHIRLAKRIVRSKLSIFNLVSDI